MATAFPADLGDRFVQFGLAPARDEHARPFGRETLGGAEADACAAAGDDGDLALESLAHSGAFVAREYDAFSATGSPQAFERRQESLGSGRRV